MPALERKHLIIFVAVAVGVGLLVVSIVYFAEPAKSLPSFFPGHQAGSTHHHFKHGIAALVVSAALLVVAWFQTGKKGPQTS